MTDSDQWDTPSTRSARDEIEPGVPATSEMPRNIPPGDEDEEEPAPREYPQGVEEWGTTAREEQLGEPFELRVRREEPDRPASSGGTQPGLSLLEPGAEDGLVDDEADLVGELDFGRDDTLAPEEAAMRVDDEPGGINYDATPSYVEDE
jgi:hypothetical protein